MLERRVVLPALSRPRRRMEYSAVGGELLLVYEECWEMKGRNGQGKGTFFAGGIEVNRFGEVVHF